MRNLRGQPPRNGRHGQVHRDGDPRGRGHVVHAKEIETREQAAEHRADDVAAIEEPEPAHPFRRRLRPARDGGQRRPHQDRGRKEEHGAGESPQQEAGNAGRNTCRIEPARDRDAEEHEDAEHRDAGLEDGVDAQGMRGRRYEAVEEEAPQAKPRHERPEKDAERDAGRADHQLQHLEPDDLVDEGRAAATEEQCQQDGERRKFHRERCGSTLPPSRCRIGAGIVRSYTMFAPS